MYSSQCKKQREIAIGSCICQWQGTFYNHWILSILNRIELGGSSKKGSQVYFLMIVAMVLILWHQIVLFCHQVTIVALEEHWFQTIVQIGKTIVLPIKLATGNIHDNLFYYCHLAPSSEMSKFDLFCNISIMIMFITFIFDISMIHHSVHIVLYLFDLD